MMQITQHMTKIIAHRGDTSQYPENTLEAFSAAKEAGADGIELDIHVTSDGVPVIHHDFYLGHPDNGDGTIKDLPYSYLKDLTILDKYFIPTLPEVFDKIGKKFHYEIELKCFTLDDAEKVISIAKSFDTISSIEFTSPHPYLLPTLKKHHPSIKTGYFTMPRPDWMDEALYLNICLSQVLLGDYDIIHLQAKYITKNTLQMFHDEGLKVHAADCDDEDMLLRMKTIGVDQLTTNDLPAALASGGDIQAYPY